MGMPPSGQSSSTMPTGSSALHTPSVVRVPPPNAAATNINMNSNANNGNSNSNTSANNNINTSGTNPNLNSPAPAVALPVSGSATATLMSQINMNRAPGGMSMSIGMGGGTDSSGKKKRGRPRKYGPDGSMALALTPLSSSAPGGSYSSSPLQKRGRGRPPGSGKKQRLAALGEWVVGSAGIGFTPHVITIAAGEDVASKIMSFSQQGPRAVCILSANGAISNVTLRQPATSGGTLTYEGRFEILSLSGSFLLTENGGARSRTGGLSVSLASPDGRVIGGGVAGMLMAASPVQVVVGSFISNGQKDHAKPANAETSIGMAHTAVSGVPTVAIPISRAPMNENYGGSHSTGEAKHNTDINISLPGG
ncbi:hypothetical protein SUGI_1187790 [Cryptomeria japonica]|nr:hypothetical protein SUGI_1187790 [Cryptomeria japonica]